MSWSYLSKFVLGTIRGSLFQYILIENCYKYGSSCYSAFSYKFPISSLIASFFYTLFCFHLHPPRAGQMVHLDTCPIRPFLKSLGSSYKARSHCSDITSTLMQSESQLQSNNTVVAVFSLNILGLPSVLCFCNAYLCQQNFLKHPPGRQTTSTNLDLGQPRRHSSSPYPPRPL